MYGIDFTDEALEDLHWFKKHERNEIMDGIASNLVYEPTTESRNRKRLRPNQIAEWELRIGKFRVFYDVESVVKIVSIVAVGEKVRETYFFQGEKREI